MQNIICFLLFSFYHWIRHLMPLPASKSCFNVFFRFLLLFTLQIYNYTLSCAISLIHSNYTVFLTYNTFRYIIVLKCLPYISTSCSCTCAVLVSAAHKLRLSAPRHVSVSLLYSYQTNFIATLYHRKKFTIANGRLIRKVKCKIQTLLPPSALLNINGALFSSGTRILSQN